VRVAGGCHCVCICQVQLYGPVAVAILHVDCHVLLEMEAGRGVEQTELNFLECSLCL
jgi:hypothetical protein